MITKSTYSSRTDVQCGQREALISIVERQNGQTFVVAGAGISFFLPRFLSQLMAETIKKMTNAIIIKLIIEVRKAPYLIVALKILIDQPLKSVVVNKPKIGEMILSVNEDTTPWKAAPIRTPTAKSITLPRKANSLKSLRNFFIRHNPFNIK